MRREPRSVVGQGLRRLLGCALLSAALGGCQGPPEVLFVEPNRVTAGEGAEVRIRGDGFVWEYNAFLDTAAIDLAADIGETPLEGVVWIDATQIEATVPATVSPGLYPITVRTQYGEDTLDDAILVLQP